MKNILFLIFISIFISSNFAQNGDCLTPSTIVQNEANSSNPNSSFTQCINSPVESGGKIITYSTVVSSPDGTLGLIQLVSPICADNSLISSRVAELFIANDCSGSPITPSETIAHTYNSTTFNPEWTGLSPSTNYTVKITINVPNSCSGSITQVCLNQYYPRKYECKTVDFSLSSFTTSFQCTDPKVNLLANDPPNTTIADKWIYPGFIIRVWSLPGFNWSNNQKLTFIDNGTVVMSEFYVGTNPMLWGIDHVQPGSYAFGITNVGVNEFGYEIVNGADGKVVESGIFKSGNTISGSHSPVGTSNYTIARVGAGAVATGVSNDPNSGGDGFFDPSISGEGTFDISYSWDNGAGCLGSKTRQVVVTCPPPPTCNASIGTFNVTGATFNGSSYDITDGATVVISNTGLVKPTPSHQLNYAFFDVAPTLPLTPSQLLNIATVPGYKGSDPGLTTSDINNSGFSSTFTTLNKVYVLPYAAATTAVVNDGTGCYAIGNIIELNYSSPTCNAAIGTFNVTGATYNGSSYDIADGATVVISNTGLVKPTPSHQLNYAFFDVAPTLPLTPSQLLNLITVPGYKGSDPGLTTSDINNSGFSSTFTTLNKVYVLPYAAATTGVVNDGTGCYAIGSIIELNYSSPPKICPTNSTFSKLNWSAGNPFGVFTPTTFSCNDGPQKIWKMPETSIGTKGEIQGFPGFQIYLEGLSTTKTSILVSVNGTPYSYYGNTAPANVIDWGPMSPLGLGGTFDIIEPFIPAGANVSIEICDTRNTAQTIPYSVYDHATGLKITSGTSTPSNGNCKSLTFTISTPIITWNIDGNVSKITNNNDGSGTFDPSLLSAGSHVINYTFTKNSCTLTASQNITINPLTQPTFTISSSQCENSVAPVLQPTSNNSIIGTWNPLTVSTSTIGKTTYTFTPTTGQCASTETVDITITPNVTPTFTLTNNFCINTLAQTLPTTSDNSITGTWSPSSIITSTAGPTSYQFTPAVNQCASGISETITIFENPIAKASPSTLSGKSVLDVNFTNLSSNATNFNWDFGNGSTSTSLGNTSSSYTNVGNYNVTLLASNGVCPDDIWKTIITVLPIDPLTFNIPNIFTPNNDGVNDHYFIELENAASFEATIFNRWGNEMISQTKINEKWDGKTASGKMSDDGVYFIKYKIVGLDKTVKEGVASFQLQN